MAASAVQIDEEALVRELVEAMVLPQGVSFKRVDQSTDWDGEPALRIFFSVSRKWPLTPRRVAALNSLKNALQEAIFSARLEKWPFVHFVEVK